MVPIGVSLISLPLHQIQSREQEEKEQTNKTNNMPGVNSSAARKLCNTAFPVYICRLTLGLDSSENSTTLLGMPIYPDRSSSLSLDPISCRLVSPLRCSVSTGHSRHPSPTTNFELLCPTLFSRPLTTSGQAEISSLKPFVWFRAKTDKGIVCLADHLHSVTTRPLTGITTAGQNEPERTGNEVLLHISKISRTRTSPLNLSLVSYLGHSLYPIALFFSGRGLTPLQNIELAYSKPHRLDDLFLVGKLSMKYKYKIVNEVYSPQ